MYDKYLHYYRKSLFLLLSLRDQLDTVGIMINDNEFHYHKINDEVLQLVNLQQQRLKAFPVCSRYH